MKQLLGPTTETPNKLKKNNHTGFRICKILVTITPNNSNNNNNFSYVLTFSTSLPIQDLLI